MISDDLNDRLMNIFGAIDGGSTDTMYSLIDEAIENGEITKQEYDDNELEIAYLFDNFWFTCSVCGWTMPMGDMGEDVNGDVACAACSDEYYGEEHDD